MNIIEIRIADRPTPEETDTILQGLIAFNELHAGPASAREMAVIARQGTTIVGGLTAFTHWNWLHIRFLWVSDAFRGRGLGTRLLKAAEAEAISRGCEHAHLDTFSFQAQPFYARFGYEEFGRLEDYPPGCSRIFLQKRNLRGR
jgi:GNAT superfamily N-acetyltransferase